MGTKMSQKTKRSLRNAPEESDTPFKAPNNQQKTKEDSQQDTDDNSKTNSITVNGNHKTETPQNGTSSPNSPGVQTRSRSTTPLVKTKSDPEHDNNDSQKDDIDNDFSLSSEEIVFEEIVESCSNISGHSLNDLDDLSTEIEKSNALQNNANILLSQGEKLASELQELEHEVCKNLEGPAPKSDDLNDTSDSNSTDTDNVSTRAVVGSDITRLAGDITYQEIPYEEPTLPTNFNYSIQRCHSFLSPRRSIRLRDETCTFAGKRKALDDLSDVTDSSKRFKNSSGWFHSYLSNLKGKFVKPPGTPELISYKKKDENEDDVVDVDGKCSIM